MAIVRTTVIPHGTHQSPDGEVRATPERVRRWADSFRKLHAGGVKFPVCWGHHSKATPGDDIFLASRYNAGYVVDLEPTAEGLSAVIDAPGLEQRDGKLCSVATVGGAPVVTAIGEVSAGLGDWTDGQGKSHADILQHIALTPLPVVAGQSGFQSLSARCSTGATVTIPADKLDEKPAGRSKLVCLSTRTLATKKDDEEKEGDDKKDSPDEEKAEGEAEGGPVEDSEPLPDDEFDDLSDDLVGGEGDPAAPMPPEAEPPMVNPDAELIASAKAALSQAGLDMPDLGGEPDLKQFLEHLVVAVTALNSQAASAREEQATAATRAGEAVAPTIEQHPPIMMSTLTGDARQLAIQMQAAQQAKRLRRIAAHEKNGLRPTVVTKLRNLATRQQLSLGRVGDSLRARKAEVDRQLDLLDEALPGAAAHLKRLGPAAVEHPNPVEGKTRSVERNGLKLTPAEAEAADRMAVASGVRLPSANGKK